MTNKLNLLLLLLLSATTMTQATAVPHVKIESVFNPDITSLEGINFSDATEVWICWCQNLMSLKGLHALMATTIKIQDCPALISIEGLDAPMATTIKIQNCPALISIEDLDAPMATKLGIKNCPDNIMLIAKEIIGLRIKRWNPLRAAWVSAAARGTIRRAAGIPACTDALHELSLAATERAHD